MTVEAARAAMLAQVEALGHETVALDLADGRTLARSVRATRDQPPFNASAMDGWAVRAADLTPETPLKIVGESAAGKAYGRLLAAGEAVRIFTGAPVPDGADQVVIQEEAERQGETVRCLTVACPGSNIRPAGQDFGREQVLLEAGQRLDPWRISLVAAAGVGQAPVFRQPRILVVATGSEIVPAGTPAGSEQIYNSGGPAVAALARGWGAIASHDQVGDSIEAIIDCVQVATGTVDLIVTLGGASVGDHDLVKPALERLGLSLVVASVAVKPGKPTWFGTLPAGPPVLGLAGNPASAMACAELFLRPLLAKFSGREPDVQLITAHCQTPLPENGAREEWLRARLSFEDGTVTVKPFSRQDSSLVTVFARASALLRRPAHAPASLAGEKVQVLPLAASNRQG
ncbi:MAG: molybdenum cofactor biosynthesis protein MoeA [Caulobacteraceae bacterium]|nr:molybdenum cofactor biosynthesis protein MoeA [Caulobacteraceae bacterium]